MPPIISSSSSPIPTSLLFYLCLRYVAVSDNFLFLPVLSPLHVISSSFLLAHILCFSYIRTILSPLSVIYVYLSPVSYILLSPFLSPPYTFSSIFISSLYFLLFRYFPLIVSCVTYPAFSSILSPPHTFSSAGNFHLIVSCVIYPAISSIFISSPYFLVTSI
jgi:hypothetical protein